MTSLAIAITDFAVPGQADTAPKLDALGRLLARGERAETTLPGWRHWVLEAAGVAPPDQLPIASIVAPRPGHWAIATPVHLLAGLEHVHLDPTGLPELAEAEWHELAQDFNVLFADERLVLTVDHGLALLEFAQPLDVLTHDPQPLAGRDAGMWLPSGPDGGRLRRLMTELQMWLHDHEVNEARVRRGLQPVNGLWIWGLGGGGLAPASAPLPRLAANDPFLRCCWESMAAPSGATPASFDAWRNESPSAGIVVISLAGLERDAALALELAEERWFAPLESALASGELTAARLFLGGVVATARRLDRMRFWRPRRAWHEALR